MSKKQLKQRFANRREFLQMGIAGAAAGLLGFQAGATSSTEPKERPVNTRRAKRDAPIGSRQFHARSREIFQRHDQQTPEAISHLKSKYENAVLGKIRVWELIEKLAFCIDFTDPSLSCTSQFTHVMQIISAMERDGIQDKDLFLVALLHDVGKVAVLANELPEHVFCTAKPVGQYKNGIGLDNVLYQFTHAEIVYSRLKDHIPEHIAWLVRYHNISIKNCDAFMTQRDRNYAEKYLTSFQKYDRKFKSYKNVPFVDTKKYRDLIEQTFPNPILF